jgi:hypothetical protein
MAAFDYGNRIRIWYWAGSHEGRKSRLFGSVPVPVIALEISRSYATLVSLRGSVPHGYGISISVQYLLSVDITSVNEWNVTGLSR